MNKKVLIKFLGILTLLLIFVPQVMAQDMSLGSAISISLIDKTSADGDIIVTSNKGYMRSATPNDPFLFGVVSKNPAIYLEDANLPNATAVITSGKAFIRVSSLNGAIKKGDFITSSKIIGVGQKAIDNGYVIGASEEEYSEKDPKKIGKVLVTLNPHFVQLNNNLTKNVIEGLKMGFSAALLTPMGALRYLVSGIIAILSFFLGFRFFGHASRNGVEAIGRNPLATKSILISVAMNVSVTVAIMFFGVAIAYLILVL